MPSTINSALPAEVADRQYGRGDTFEAQSLQDLAEREAIERGKRALVDRTWWSEEMEKDGAVRDLVPGAIARCMANLDRACRGEQIGMDAILTALSNLRAEVRGEAEESEEV